MTIGMLLFFFVLGLCFGSFGNVVIARVPLRQSIVKPRSRCPLCKTPIKWIDNIPIISFLLLKGRCRHCKVSISWRYPFVEFLSGLLFASLLWKVGLSFTLIEYLIL